MERALAAAAAKHIDTPSSLPAKPTQQQQSTQSTSEPPSPAEAPSSPPTSGALAYIPSPLPSTIDGVPISSLPLRDIHPWDLQSPIPISNCQPIFYDAATQEYFLFTCDGAILLHKTHPITIPKRTARKFLYDWPSTDDHAVELLATRLKIPKSTSPSLVSDHVVVYHAVHDSIIVKRRSGNTGLFKFCVDKVCKVGNPGFLLQDVYTRVVRPEFGCVLKCTCPKVYYFGRTVYCPTCTSYRTPLCMNLQHLTPKAPHVLGKITMPVHIARIILYQCFEPGTTTLSIPRAYKALTHCFNMHDVSEIPVREGELVSNLLRDCLFVEVEAGRTERQGSEGSGRSSKIGRGRGKGKGSVVVQMHRVCWASFFNIPDEGIPRGRRQGRVSVSGSGETEVHENYGGLDGARPVAVAA
ncbi:hypothetical protein BJX64DRAFT_292641 [Aspergillus heterothallicus]